MYHFMGLKRRGHGHHHKPNHHHKRLRRDFGKGAFMFGHMEKPCERGRRRCLSESDLPNIAQRANVQEQIRRIVKAFFDRRSHWGRSRCCWGRNNENSGSSGESGNEATRCKWRRHHHFDYRGCRGNSATGRDTEAEHEGKETDETNATDGQQPHQRRHGLRHHRHGFRGGKNQGRDTDEEKSSGCEGKEMDKGKPKRRRRHDDFHDMRHRHGYGFRHCGRQGRFTEEDPTSSSGDDKKKNKKKHHRGHGHRHGHRSRGWRRCGCCAEDTTTVTQGAENISEEPGQNEINADQVMEIAGENQGAIEYPKSPEVQEVADNLRNSSLE